MRNISSVFDMYVNRPVGSLIPDSMMPSRYSSLYYTGSRVEFKHGACDAGNGTKEERVILVYDMWGKWSAYNRHGDSYNKIPDRCMNAIHRELRPLTNKGFVVFDGGYFPQGKWAGKLIIYGLPKHDSESLSYGNMRQILEEHLPVYSDKAVHDRYLELVRERYDCNGRTIISWRHENMYTDVPNVSVFIGPALSIISGTTLDTHATITEGHLPQDPLERLDLIWQAMKDTPSSTYEGFVIKNIHYPESYREKQGLNKSWIKIKWRG